MPSIETQNISVAVVQSLQTQDHAPIRPPNHTPTPQQVSQASQSFADKTTISAREDSERSTQVPKRAEGAFAPQRAKRKPDAAPKEAEKEAATPNSHRLYVKA